MLCGFWSTSNPFSGLRLKWNPEQRPVAFVGARTLQLAALVSFLCSTWKPVLTLTPSTGVINGQVSEALLPGAIYLFVRVVGGAFWLARRKRNQRSGVGIKA